MFILEMLVTRTWKSNSSETYLKYGLGCRSPQAFIKRFFEKHWSSNATFPQSFKAYVQSLVWSQPELKYTIRLEKSCLHLQHFYAIEFR